MTQKTTLIGKYSPWGKIQHCYEVLEGFHLVSTPGHGGVKLNRARNAQIPASVRKAGGWYEEDCEYCIPYIVFGDEILEHGDRKGTDGNYSDKLCVAHYARVSAKDWYPDFYESFTGESVPLEESYTRRQAKFWQDHRDDFVVYSARSTAGSDTVLVVANKESTGESKQFYVDADSYRNRESFGYVIDEEKDQEVVYSKVF